MTHEERAKMMELFAAMHDTYAAKYRLAASCERAAQSVSAFNDAWVMSTSADEIANSDIGEFEKRVTDLLERG